MCRVARRGYPKSCRFTLIGNQMNKVGFFSVASISLSRLRKNGPCSLLNAAKHNKREGLLIPQPKQSNPETLNSTANTCLIGPFSAIGVSNLATNLLNQAGYAVDKLRRDYCQAIEFLFSLPADWVQVDEAYFYECLNWLQSVFPSHTVLSADIHRDEGAPHLHVLISPVSDGKLRGSEIIDRTQLRRLRNSFWETVAAPAGLKPQNAKFIGRLKEYAVDAVLKHLNDVGDPVLTTTLWPITRKAIEKDPLSAMRILNLNPDQSVKKMMQTENSEIKCVQHSKPNPILCRVQ